MVNDQLLMINDQFFGLGRDALCRIRRMLCYFFGVKGRSVRVDVWLKTNMKKRLTPGVGGHPGVSLWYLNVGNHE